MAGRRREESAKSSFRFPDHATKGYYPSYCIERQFGFTGMGDLVTSKVIYRAPRFDALAPALRAASITAERRIRHRARFRDESASQRMCIERDGSLYETK